ncbi:N-acetyltransferase ESCO2 [Tiliqua scincoides]|uniref:N-acetyltransferase ESCO2 n=1 Tax=Tiliqua scincoides TaxID=71010 RepID=UPI003461F192
MQRGLPQTMSPKTGATYNSIVPTSSFYSKGKQYQSLLERKLTNESHSLGLRDEGGNLPTANKTEIVQVKVLTARKTNSKAPKRPAASRQAKTLSRNSKKAKVDMAPPKSVTGKENTNCAIEKKMDAPFRVLSMKFKPVLKLRTGAAFFATGKKWHSGSEKVLSAPSFPHCASEPMVKEKQDTCRAHKQLHSSTKNRKGSPTNESQKKEKLTHNSSQDTDIMSELNLLQETGSLQTSYSGCLKTLAPKETDTETQTSEEISHGSSRNMHENGTTCKLSNKTIKDYICPLFSTPSSNKKRSQVLPDEQSSLVEFSPIVQMVPTILKPSKKTKELSKDLKGQMVIDAGQKHFGAMVCKSCGMVYSAANPEDEAQHIQYHQRFLGGMKYVGWKNERVVTEFLDGKVVLVLQDDPKYATKKAEDVRKFVDNELGFKQVVLTHPTPTQTYLFVSNEKKIVGCLIAEPVRQAFRVISEPPSESPTKNSLEHHRAWCCSSKPEKVICGVSRIWVFSLMRRKGIASRLVDVVRRTFLFGSYLTTDEIAFSDPTPDGKLFATKYCQTPSFLVYNFLN